MTSTTDNIIKKLTLKHYFFHNNKFIIHKNCYYFNIIYFMKFQLFQVFVRNLSFCRFFLISYFPYISQVFFLLKLSNSRFFLVSIKEATLYTSKNYLGKILSWISLTGLPLILSKNFPGFPNFFQVFKIRN